MPLKERPPVRPAKIIRQALKECEDDNILTHDLKTVRRNVYNVRRKMAPPLPTNLSDVHDYLDCVPVLTNKGETNIFVFK